MTEPLTNMDEGELRLLERLAAILTSLNQPEEVLERLMDLFLVAMDAERGLLLAFGDAGEARPMVTRNLSAEAVTSMTAGFTRRAIDAMADGKQIVVSEDVLHDSRFRDSESVIAHNIQSLLTVPIRVGGKLHGAIYIDHRASTRAFTPRDIAFARALAELTSIALERSEGLRALADENSELRARAGRYEFGSIIGTSDAMQRMFERLANVRAAPADASILLTGENGTGKTEIAKLLHRQSARRDRPFVSFPAANVPESLVESELFGHRRGAFTGANSEQIGLVTRGEGGTLFIDDIDCLNPSIQAKFLTFLQERIYRPLGSGDTRKSDIRVICATNAKLEDRVKLGLFREDLYYRVNVISIEVPPLRERNEDITLLARHFLSHIVGSVEKEIRGFSPEVLARMLSYRWPGNVRELQSEIVHAVTMTKGPLITPADMRNPAFREGGSVLAPDELDLELAINNTIRRVIELALSRSDGNITHAAEAARVSRSRFYDMMNKVGLETKPKRGRPRKDDPADSR